MRVGISCAFCLRMVDGFLEFSVDAPLNTAPEFEELELAKDISDIMPDPDFMYAM